jgi:hypothetical protein
VADEFLQIKAVGRGLRLNESGVLLVDLSRDLSWSGQHVFTEPVQFSGSQRYQIEQIVDNNAALGAVYWHNGLAIQKAVPSGPYKVLLFDGSRVSWSTPAISHVTGVLSVDNGGTGLSRINRGAILFAADNNYIAGLPAGAHGQALIIQNGLPSWGFVGNIRGDTSTGFVPMSASVNYLSDSPIFVTGDTVELTGTLKVGANLVFNSNTNHTSIGTNDVSIILKKTGAFEIGSTKFNTRGVMTAGGIQADLIQGLIPVSKGGTGLNALAPGDLLYANESGSLSRLAAPNGAGWVIGTNTNGMPVWVDIASVKIEGGYRRVKLETDGTTLFFVNDNKERIALIGAGRQSTPSVTPVHLGGTGDDLSGVTKRGAILTGRSRDAWTAIQPGPAGHILSSSGTNEIPHWIEPPLIISAGLGIKIINKEVSIDTSTEISWIANHSFESLRSKAIEADSICLKTLNNLESPKVGALWTDGDDVYLQTRRGKKALINFGEELNTKHIVVLSIAQALNLSDIALQASKLAGSAIVVPFSVVNPSSITRWKLKRIDVLPFGLSEPIRLQVNRNGQEILENYINVHNTQVGCINFTESILTSGDVLCLSAVVDGINGLLNATALLEEYHG